MTPSFEHPTVRREETLTTNITIERPPEVSHERLWSNPDVPHHACYFIDWMVQHAKTSALADTYRNTFDEHGDAFAAFLSIDDVDSQSATVRQDFLDAYLWTSPDRDALIDQQLDDLSWSQALSGFMSQHNIYATALRWDRHVLWQLIDMTFQVIPMYGALYVFEK